MNNKISIIIPTYNAEKTLRNTLESIITQKYKNYEIIIIDGNSNDATMNIVNEYKEYIDYFVSEKDLGIYDAMNKGIDKSKGDWLFFLGADDCLYHNILENVFNHEFDNVHFIYGNVKFDSGRVMNCYFNYKMIFGHSVYHQSIFYRRDIFNDLRYSIDYKISADYFINLQLWKKNITSLYINDFFSICGDDGLSKQVYWYGYFDTVKIAYKVIGPLAITTLVSNIIRYSIKKVFLLVKKN